MGEQQQQQQTVLLVPNRGPCVYKNMLFLLAHQLKNRKFQFLSVDVYVVILGVFFYQELEK